MVSSNTGLLTRKRGSESFDLVSENILEKRVLVGASYSRVTEKLPVPKIGDLRILPDFHLFL